MTGKTYYVLNGGQRNGTASSVNDTTFYGASANSSRYNEIALTSSSMDRARQRSEHRLDHRQHNAIPVI